MRPLRIANHLLVLVIAAATCVVSVGWNAPSSAAAGNILSPFTVGEQWYVFQGYSSGTHINTSQYGLDLTIGTSTTSTAGKTVRAPMAGTIYYWQASYGNLCVNTPNGRSYTMTHINASRTSGAVSAGEALGTVAAAGQAGNNNVAHLHFEFWSGPGCYDQSTPIPLDAAHGTRMCGAPDFTASGPNAGNGTWSKTYFTAQSCDTGSNPQGNVDGASSPTAGTFNVRGWAFDRDAATSPISVHAYVGGPAGSAAAEGFDLGPADVSRPDVGNAFPGVGNNHGFDKTVSTGKRGSQPVYVYAINVGGGGNVLIGQGTVNIADPDPFGSFDTVTSSPHRQVRVGGWAIDRNAPTSPVTIHAYVGGAAGAAGAEFHDLGPAATVRTDVAAAFPGTGQNHGFDATFTTAKSGSPVVFVYAINQGPGNHRLLLSRTVAVAEDTTAPETTIDKVDSNTTTASVFFSSNESAVSFECSVASAAWTTCTSPTTVSLTAGPSTIDVRAKDVAGNLDATPARATVPALTAPAVIVPPTTAPPTTTAPGGRRLTVQIRVTARGLIRLDVDPDWRKGSYRVVAQERIRGAWKRTARTRTVGRRDTRGFDPAPGTYRFIVKRKGFDTYVSGPVRVRR